MTLPSLTTRDDPDYRRHNTVRDDRDLGPLTAKTLKDDVVAVLTDTILSGKFKPGDRLNESHLGRQLRVSRAPIREALQQLEEQGLVVNRSRRGMFVVKLEQEDLQKMNSLRLVLESEALRLAARNLTVAGEKGLTQLLQQMEAIEGAPAVRCVHIDLEFHRTIWALSGNEYLEKMLVSLTAPLFAHALLTTLRDEQVRMILDSHRPLLEFLQGRRKESAETIVIEHLSLRWIDPVRFASSSEPTR